MKSNNTCSIIISAHIFMATVLPVFGQYNAVDGVSSASGKFQLLGGQAYENRADITWKDGYNNGSQHLLKWGTTTSYGNQINLKPFPRNSSVTTSISGLVAGTKYYGQFFRYYEGRARTTNFEFTTYGTQTAISSMGLGHNAIIVTSLSETTVYNMSGIRIATISADELQKVNQGKTSLISPHLSAGKYIAITKDLVSGKTIRALRFVVQSAAQ